MGVGVFLLVDFLDVAYYVRCSAWSVLRGLCDAVHQGVFMARCLADYRGTWDVSRETSGFLARRGQGDQEKLAASYLGHPFFLVSKGRSAEHNCLHLNTAERCSDVGESNTSEYTSTHEERKLNTVANAFFSAPLKTRKFGYLSVENGHTSRNFLERFSTFAVFRVSVQRAKNVVENFLAGREPIVVIGLSPQKFCRGEGTWISVLDPLYIYPMICEAPNQGKRMVTYCSVW